MTTDSEAWDRFVAILRRNEQHLTADAAAQVAGWLREWQKRGDFEASQGADAEERTRHPASAAEEKEAPRVSPEPCIRCGRPNVCGEHAVWCHARDEGAKTPKSSSDSMEERIQALEDGIRKYVAVRDHATTHLGEGTLELLAAKELFALVMPAHQPWCRGDHSEGTCAPSEPEVDREE